LSNVSQGIALDDISGGARRVPAGRYTVRPVAIAAKDSKAGKPMITIDYEIVGGEYDGDSLKQFFTMYIGMPRKAGDKFFAPGIAELKALLAAVGSPWPNNVNFPVKENEKGEPTGDAQAAVKVFAASLRGKTFTAANVEELAYGKDESGQRVQIFREDGTPAVNTRLKVLGLAGGSSAASASSGSQPLL
jgi:hypothetical protein